MVTEIGLELTDTKDQTDGLQQAELFVLKDKELNQIIETLEKGKNSQCGL